MKTLIEHRILHLIYERTMEEIPREVMNLCNQYEGDIKGRIGCNFPLSFVRSYDRMHPFLKRYEKEVEYVIIYKKADISTKKHELQHAKYHMDSEFRKEVEQLWHSFTDGFRHSVTTLLTRMKYPEQVWLDEFQAYYYTEKEGFFGKPLYQS